ncbi:MAG: adenylate/guanylate cyclase domain-containing protein [Verrucomicrobia bacterium]|nr:adenylate/guanylate cyclase domain-containing protein [Verrucomicrobiota bacterium]
MQPTGDTFTFLFTDIERSSALWEMHPQAMGRSLAQHDALMRAVLTEHRGHVFKTMGDAFCVAFGNPLDAVQAAVTAQRQLAVAVWEETGPLRVRMALHTGEVERRDGDYFGPTLNRVARVLSTGHGGQTLLSGTTAALVKPVLPVDISLRDLGERRLKDLSRPERIFQCVVTDLPADFPPLRSLEVMPNNLPAQVTSFVGRSREMAEVKRLLGTTRMLTLTGPGGTGKTRLSMQVAAEVLETFPHGVWLIELATVTDPELVPERLTEAMEIRTEAGRTALETLLDALKTRHLLLVLDNCEHVIAACAQLATTLLQRCREVRILASSREALNIPGEIQWLVPALALPDAPWSGTTPDFEQLAALESVQLFVDRAAAVRPGFELTPQNAPLVAEIVWRLDGIPLALELAAARIKVLTLPQIRERLDDRFKLLTGGSRTALPRQQTLGALIEWSHDLLSEPERRLLRRLCVFVAGRTLEMAEEVCSGEGLERSEIFDLLSSLADKSLIMVERGPEDTTRYTLLESIWIFGEEKLEQHQETARFQRRHLEYFVRFARTAEPELFQKEQKIWLDRLSIEHPNLLQALRTSLESPETVELGLRLAGSLIRYWEVRNYFVEGYDLCRQLLAKAPDSVDPSVRAKALLGAGRLAWCQDRDQEAHRFYLEAHAHFVKLDQEEYVALTEAYLGFIERNEGHPFEARAHFDQADEIAGVRGYRRVSAMVANGRGSLEVDAGNFVQARAWKEQALAELQEVGDPWIVGLVRGSLGKACVHLRDLTAARTHLREALTIARDLGNKWAIPYVLEVIGEVCFLEGRPDKAIRLYGAASVQREALVLSFSKVERIAFDESLQAMKSAVSPARFEAEWSQGRELGWIAAVRLALE